MAKVTLVVPTQEQNEKISLYLKNDTSDKEYHIQLEKNEEGWQVAFQYGRRGRSLTSKFKNTAPLTFAEAWTLYEKTKRGQLADGYTEDISGALYQSADREAQFTGNVPQLLNNVEDVDFLALMDQDDWLFQEKFDGERLMMKKEAGVVTGSNKKGLRVAIPKDLEAAVLALPCESCLLDSEQLGVQAAVFDCLMIDGVDLRVLGVEARRQKLEALLGTNPHESFVQVLSACDTASKQKLYETVKAGNGEGLVGKKKTAIYEPGRPNSGGNQLKHKFCASATVVVTSVHKTKRSVGVGAYDEKGVLKDLGNITIHPNQDIPGLQAIVEVRYLYAYEGGKLFQTDYRGVRSDQDLTDCIMAQLKFKADGPVSVQKPKMKAF